MLLLSSATRILATEHTPRALTRLRGLYHRYWSIRPLWRQRKAGGYVSKGAMSNTDSRASAYVEEKSCLFCMAFGERWATSFRVGRSEEHTSELQSLAYLVCRLLLEKKKK